MGSPMNDHANGFIQHMLGINPGAVRGPGDYVYSEGQLNRIIADLMEQAPGNAPPPAPREVMDALPKVKVGQSRVNEGEDCAVCKEELVVDEEVTQLPCKHV